MRGEGEHPESLPSPAASLPAACPLLPAPLPLTPAAQRRLATLERQLERYLGQALPPATSALQARRRRTYRQRVIRDNLRAQRCLRETGSEVGWRATPLTPEDEARVGALLAQDAGP